MKRRDFLKSASLAALAGPSIAAAAPKNETESMVGVQIAPFTILDEGIERCLDTLREKGNINALFIYSQTYHMGTKPRNVLAGDHGVPVRNFANSKLPWLWVRQNPKAFAGKPVRHQQVTPDYEFADRDLFAEIEKPANQREMKVYARILEAGSRRKDRIPGYDQVLTVDHEGKPGHGPCWNNPHYREWVLTTVRELIGNYPLDGFQYGAERTGPLSHVLYRGLTPTCFCQHCIDRNTKQDIDAEQARTGFTRLLNLVRRAENNKPLPPEGMLSSVMRVFYQYPEVLSWDYQWFQADEEVCSEVHQLCKRLNPEIDSGRHVDHQRSSWDFFYRSATSYEQMARNADFIKPIVYHDPMGPRLRWWVLERLQQRILKQLSLEQSLELFYAVFGHDPDQMPTLDRLDADGLGPAYVYREIDRCRQIIGDKAKLYAGIGIDVPWYIPGGMEPRPSDPDLLKKSVVRAFEAGADGVLASREYNEMRLSSLVAFGQGVQEAMKR